MYREAPPPERLSTAVSCLWWSDRDRPKRIVPDGCVDLIIGAGTVFVAGPDTHAWESAARSALHGIRFRLRRRFTIAVGYGPATYLRVARLRRAVTRGRTTTLASLAADAGYADQAHLSRDCRELTGSSPAEFFR